MMFLSTVTTEDGRLTRNKRYNGRFVRNLQGELRVALYDNKNEVMTFNPKVLIRLSKNLS